MGQNLSKCGDGTTTNFSKELNININDIIKCELIESRLHGEEHIVYKLNVIDVKNVIKSMDVCNYQQTTFIPNAKNRIKITYADNSEQMLALSDCGKFIGSPTRTSGWAIWFYLWGPHDNIFNPFQKFVKNSD